MTTTVTGKNMVTIPADIARELGIRPGWRLDWRRGSNEDELVVRVLPDRAELARRLQGSGREHFPRDVDAVAELDDERARDDEEESG